MGPVPTSPTCADLVATLYIWPLLQAELQPQPFTSVSFSLFGATTHRESRQAGSRPTMLPHTPLYERYRDPSVGKNRTRHVRVLRHFRCGGVARPARSEPNFAARTPRGVIAAVGRNPATVSSNPASRRGSSSRARRSAISLRRPDQQPCPASNAGSGPGWHELHRAVCRRCGAARPGRTADRAPPRQRSGAERR
jgi:hypothetical protein